MPLGCAWPTFGAVLPLLIIEGGQTKVNVSCTIKSFQYNVTTVQVFRMEHTILLCDHLIFGVGYLPYHAATTLF